MQKLPTDIYSVAAVREIDRTAIQENGIPGYTLMTRAGAAAVQAARERFPDTSRWQVVCGAGNNGGDGYVVARLAASEGIVVSALTLVDPDKLTGDAATAHGDFVAEGGVVMPWSGELDAEADLLFDAMLGSGLERKVGGEYAAAVGAMNAHPAPVVALDIPTGIHGDTGEVLGCAVEASHTVTFVGLKAGLFVAAAPDFVGTLEFAGLDIPDDCRAGADVVMRRIDSEGFAGALAPRKRTAHKGDFGHVVVVGGAAGMPGAVRLCGEAALRAGAGRVSIATHPAHAATLVASRPELMVHGVATAAELRPLLDKADVLAFGPGLGQADWAHELFAALKGDKRPAVWDADALNLLAAEPHSAGNRIITPHPGEAARLLGQSVGDVQSDRVAAANALVARYGGVAVLKGAGSLVAEAGATPVVCSAGNPGMAVAGMGDVLTGIIAAFVAQGMPVALAAAYGVEAHARAGDLAARAGQRGLLASDLLAELRTVVNP